MSPLPVRVWGPADALPVVLLHGFLGDSRSWHWLQGDAEAPVVRWIAVDLPGHGAAAHQRPTGGWPAVAALLDDTLAPHLQGRAYVVAGYSMGGRIAAHWVLHGAWPQRHPPRGVLLESAHPGLDASARLQRCEADRDRAAELRDRGLQAFVEQWQSLALFASQRAASSDRRRLQALQAQRRLRLAQDPQGLAFSLLHLGTGTMPRLDVARPPPRCTAITLCGALDRDYVTMASRWELAFDVADHVVAADCGHNVHLEDPLAWRRALGQLL